MRAALLALSLAAPIALAADAGSVPAFSSQAPADRLPPGWSELVPPRAKAPRFSLVAEAGTTVLRVSSEGEAGAAAFALRVDPARRPILAWRWKVDRVVEKADLASRGGDDFAARVYVFFDVPARELPLGARVRLALARLLYGAQLPGAAICYVWDNRHPSGTAAWSPYTDRVRMVVLESGTARAGTWTEERRDLVADYRAAFGAEAPLHDISGIAVGNDTDQTGEAVTAWFGDLRLVEGGA
ncbi:MAG TPA: DUF3047 domain-containing protein [Usitatibacter sp.]|nr:DUF3047 domain-containing protein [Usitatibacter sp.]